MGPFRDGACPRASRVGGCGDVRQRGFKHPEPAGGAIFRGPGAGRLLIAQRGADRVCPLPLGRIPKWPKGTGCKPVGVFLRRFESCSAHLTNRSPEGLFAQTRFQGPTESFSGGGV